MTHTLHPEIENSLLKASEEIAYKFEESNVVDIINIIYKHLSKHLLPPSQHLKDETKQCTACLWHKTHSKYTASKGTIEVNCSRCNGTGLETVYDEKPKTYTFEQMEAEYDRWFTNWLLAIGGKKEELKQSTPKIEKIELTKDDDYWGDTHKKLNEIIDYINNSLPTR